MSADKKSNPESGNKTLVIDGDEITVKYQKRKDDSGERGLHPYIYLTTTNYQDKFFKAEHSDLNKAFRSIEIQIEQFKKDN